MTKQFIHSYELYIGNAITITPESFTPFQKNVDRFIPIDRLIDTNEATAFMLSEHHMEFEIKKTKGGKGKNSTISIYNISDDIKNYLDSKNTQKPFILLKAGYRSSGLKEIFRGQVEAFETVHEGTTSKTQLSVSGGGEIVREAQSVRTYEPGTRVDVIVNDLLDDLGIPKSALGVLELGEGARASKQVYINGNTSYALWKLGEDYGFDFTVNDVQSQVVPPLKTTGPLTAKVISADTDLIGTVEPKDKSGGAAKGENEDRKSAIRFKIVLDGNIRPGGHVFVDDSGIEGAFKVSEVVHRGSYEGDEWTTEITAERMQGVIRG